MTLIELADLAKTNGWNIVDQILYELYLNSPSGGGSTNNAVLTSEVKGAFGAETGSVAAGSLAVTFTTSDDFEGELNGVSRDASTSYVFNPTTGYLNPEITYGIVTGTIKVDIYTKP